MKKKIYLTFILTLFVSFIYSDQYKVNAPVKFDSVILLIGDGMTTSGKTIARWYKQGYLSMDRMYRAEIRTFSADSVITDSAAAATAFATGYKTVSEMLGVITAQQYLHDFQVKEIPHKCDNNTSRPSATILEAAKLKGKSVGLVSTSEVEHATPAGFAAHVIDRDNMTEIAEQEVYQDLNVVFGGGKKYLLPKSVGGVREDGENLVEVLKKRGYIVTDNLDELKNKNIDKVWGLLASEDLAFEMDRKELGISQPSLREMTEAAVQILSKDPDGFFLMVEGSKIDWAAHDNDPVGVIGDVLSFDEAVKAALDFAEKDGHTLVLVLADHGSGGITLGNKTGGKVPYHTSYDEVYVHFKKAKLTIEGVANLLKECGCDLNKSLEIIKQYYGIDYLDRDQLEVIEKCKIKKIKIMLGQAISNLSLIGWTTTAHTGEDIILNSNYPIERNSEIKTLFDNTEIALLTDELLNLNLQEADRLLYIDAKAAFTKIGAEIHAEKSDDNRMKIIVTQQIGEETVRMELPVNTDLCILESKIKEIKTLQGITIYLKNSESIFISSDAIGFFQEMISKNTAETAVR